MEKLRYLDVIKDLLINGANNWRYIVECEFYIMPFLLYNGAPELYDQRIFESAFDPALDMFVIFMHQQFLVLQEYNPADTMEFAEYYYRHSKIFVRDIWCRFTDHTRAGYQEAPLNFNDFAAYFMDSISQFRSYDPLIERFEDLRVETDENNNPIMPDEMMPPFFMEQHNAVEAPIIVEAPVIVAAPVDVEAPVIVQAPVIVEAPVDVELPVEGSFLQTWGFSILSGIGACTLFGIGVYCGTQVPLWI